MFENPRRGRQTRNFTTNVPKILDLKSSSEQIFSENCLFDNWWSSLLSTQKETILREFSWGSSWFLTAKLWLANNVWEARVRGRYFLGQKRSDDRKYLCVRKLDSSGNDLLQESAWGLPRDLSWMTIKGAVRLKALFFVDFHPFS